MMADCGGAKDHGENLTITADSATTSDPDHSSDNSARDAALNSISKLKNRSSGEDSPAVSEKHLYQAYGEGVTSSSLFPESEKSDQRKKPTLKASSDAGSNSGETQDSKGTLKDPGASSAAAFDYSQTTARDCVITEKSFSVVQNVPSETEKDGVQQKVTKTGDSIESGHIESGVGCEDQKANDKCTETIASGLCSVFPVVVDSSAQNFETNGENSHLRSEDKVDTSVSSNRDIDTEETDNTWDKVNEFEHVTKEKTNTGSVSEDFQTKPETDDISKNIDYDTDTGSFTIIDHEDDDSERSSLPMHFEDSDPMWNWKKLSCGLLGKQARDRASDEASSVKESVLSADADSMGRKKQHKAGKQTSKSKQMPGQSSAEGSRERGQERMQSVGSAQIPPFPEAIVVQAGEERHVHDDPFDDTFGCDLEFRLIHKSVDKTASEQRIPYPEQVQYCKWLHFLADKVEASLKFASESDWKLEGNRIVIRVVCSGQEKETVETKLVTVFQEMKNTLKSIKPRKYTLQTETEGIKKMLDSHKEFSSPALLSIVSKSTQRLLLLSEDGEIINRADAMITSWKGGNSNENLEQMPSQGTSTSAVHSYSEKGEQMSATDSAKLKVHGTSTLVTNQADVRGASSIGETVSTKVPDSQSKFPGKATRTSTESGTKAAKNCSLRTLEAEFLKQPKVSSDFMYALNDARVCIDRKKFETENVLVVTRKDAEDVSDVLQRFMHTSTLAVQEEDPEVIAILEQLKQNLGEYFCYKFEPDHETLIIVCHAKDKEKVLSMTKQLMWVEKQIPLPLHMMKNLFTGLRTLPEQMKNSLPKLEVNIQVKSIGDQGPTLLVRAERKFFPLVRDVLDKELAKLWCLQLRSEVESETGLGLPEPEVDLQCDVSTHMQIPGHELLLRACSPQGHQVLVYEGNIMAANCHVIILPICASRKNVSAMHQWILKKGLLSKDPAVFGASLQPPESFTLTLHCRPGAAEAKHVVVMHVPPSSSGKFKDHVAQAVREAMKSAVSLLADVEISTIALPLTLGAKDNDWKCVLPVVVETLTAMTGTPVTVKLYFDKTIGNSTADAGIMSEVKKHLSNPEWTTESFCRATFPLESRIRLTIGDICSQSVLEETDVLVNTADPQLQLTGRGVSYQIGKKGGQGLKDECREKAGTLTHDDLVVITGGHDLKPVKEIFHVVLEQETWKKTREQFLLGALQAKVVACLALASSKGHKKITFPALGTGNCNYPPEKVANIMFTAAENFFALMPHSSIQTVDIVCYPQAKDEVLKSFKEREMVSETFQQARLNAHQGGSGEVMAVVGICGSKQEDVRIAALKWKPKQAISEVPADEGSEVDPPRYGAHAKSGSDYLESQRSTSEEKDMCYFTIPTELFTMERQTLLLSNSEIMPHICNLVTVTEPVPSKQISVAVSNLLPVVREVVQLLNKPLKQQNRAGQATQVQEQQQKYITTVHKHDYVALKALMSREFETHFEVLKHDGDQMTIAGREPSTPKQVIDKIQSLRNEEVLIPSEEAMKLGEPFDTISEGVDAFILPLPEEGKVIIFSFEYNNLSKAKHLVNVRIGKVKVTTRGRRRFDGTSPDHGGSIADQSLPDSLRPTSPHTVTGAGTVTADFTTKSGIKVSVYKTDITKLPVDAIVNAANGNLAHGGGVAYAIARAAGFELEEEGDAYIKDHGPLKVTEVAMTTAGALPCKKVLHAVGPCWHDYEDKSLCKEDLIKTVFNCLKTADDSGLTSLAFSSISSAIFGVPKQLCAECYLSAIQSFDDQHGQSTRLKQVHFVDVSDDMVGIIGRTFTEHWNKPISATVLLSSANGGNREGGKTHQWNTERMQKNVGLQEEFTLPRSGEHTKQIEPASSGAMSGLNWSEHRQPSTRMNSDLNQTSLGLRGTQPGARSFSSQKTPADKVDNKPREAYRSSPPGKEQGLHSQQITQGPQIETVVHEGKTQFQVHFGGMDLILQQQSINFVMADYIFLWQLPGYFFQDVYSQAIKKREQTFEQDIPLLVKTLQREGIILYPCGRQQILLQVIDPDDARSKDKICQIVGKLLEKVHPSVGSTVVMPAFLPEHGPPEAFQGFALGVCLAIKNYMRRSDRCIRDVHIVDSSMENLKNLVDCIKSLLADPDALVCNDQNPSGLKCAVCLDVVQNPTQLDKCGHTFCTACIAKCFEKKPVCPECQTPYGIIFGDQPKDGKMKMKRKDFRLPGCTEDTLVIEYEFPSGTRNGEHYHGTDRKAYLPNSKEGRKVLMLLKIAFDRQLVFTVDYSATQSAKVLSVVWNNIHHKTDLTQDSVYGYPDSRYLNRVQEELAAKGVTSADLIGVHEEFIHNPKDFFPTWTPHGDFSGNLNSKQKGFFRK